MAKTQHAKGRSVGVFLHLRILAVLVVLVLATIHDAAYALEPAPEPEEDSTTQVSYLFQLTAAGAMYEGGVGEHDGVLSLIDTANSTVIFSDRPERIAYTASTDALLAEVFAPVDGSNENSFYADPPNAAFSCMDMSGTITRAVYVLRAPSVSIVNDASLSFEVDVLYTDVADDVSCDGLATLVIDSSYIREKESVDEEEMAQVFPKDGSMPSLP